MFAQDQDYKVPRANDLYYDYDYTTPTNNKTLRAMGLESSRWFICLLKYMQKPPEDGDYLQVKIYRCSAYPIKKQTIHYVINGWGANGGFTGFTRLGEVKRQNTGNSSEDSVQFLQAALNFCWLVPGSLKEIIKIAKLSKSG